MHFAPIRPLFTLAICSVYSVAMVPGVPAADKMDATQLIELAKAKSPKLEEAITATFGAKDLKEGTAWAGSGPDFFFALEAAGKPELIIDDETGPAMQPLARFNLWYAAARIEQVGKLHSFHYLVNGHSFGGKLDIPAFTPVSYRQPGIPFGKLSDRI